MALAGQGAGTAAPAEPAPTPADTPPAPGAPGPAPDAAAPVATPTVPVQPSPGPLPALTGCEVYAAPSGQPVLVCLKGAEPPWLEMVSAAAPTGSVLVALAGLYVVHRLTVSRQRRDERFKLCQAARDLANEIADQAAEAWRRPGRDEEARRSASEVVGKLGRLGRQLEMLRGRDARFAFGDRLIAFRQAATTDLADPAREPSAERAGAVLATAGELEDAIDRTFRELHG